MKTNKALIKKNSFYLQKFFYYSLNSIFNVIYYSISYDGDLDYTDENSSRTIALFSSYLLISLKLAH